MKKQFDFKDFNGDDFDAHIRTSIPNFGGLYKLIPYLTQNFSVKGSNVYDIGCSSGRLLGHISSSHEDNDLSYIGYDINDNLFNKQPEKNVQLYQRDVTEDSLTLFNTSLVMSVFTLQFLTLDKRVQLVDKVYKSLSKRGCFLVCEKIYAENGITEDIFTATNFQLKTENGFSADEILDKQEDLKSIMYPLSQSTNESMFRAAGFEVIEVFFKSLNFIGWILIK